MKISQAKAVISQYISEDWRRLIASGRVFIKTKQMTLIPFVPNKVQRRYLNRIWKIEQEGRPVRLIVPKARQHGISTATEAYIYARTAYTPNINSIIVADTKEHATGIFEMSKLIHDKMDLILKPETKKTNAHEIEFKEQHSKIVVSSDARSGTFHIFHSSETAFYQNAEETMLGVLQTVPYIPGTTIIMESTGNGKNWFYDACQAAKNGTGKYELFFIPWFENDDYRSPAPDNFTAQSTGEYGNEVLLQETFNLTNDQLQWRRDTIIDNCGRDINMFMQEYPATLEEAFRGTGYPVFNTTLLEVMAKMYNRKHAYSGIINGKVIDLDVAGDGWLKVWSLPPSEIWENRYVIGADTGGVYDGADYSTAYVMDRVANAFVANVHGHFDAYEYALILSTLASWYHRAIIAIEINVYESEADEFGETVIDRLKKKHPKTRLYTRKIRDDQGKETTSKIGWHTNIHTKQLLVDRLRRHVNEVRTGGVCHNDEELVKEMHTYVVGRTKTGKTTWNAIEGKKDDRVIAAGITLCVSDEQPAPKISKRYTGKGKAETYIEALIA